MQIPVFDWHPQARALGPDGGAAAEAAPLSAAMRGKGVPFRIGGVDGVEAAPGQFETLTGGSTGQPRRVIRSQVSWIASFAVNAVQFGIGTGARVAVLGDLSHSLALYAAVEGLHQGAEVHFLAPLRPDRQARAMDAAGVTHLYATPPQIYLMLQRTTRLPHLRHVIIGGARLDEPLAVRMRQAAPQARLWQFYGAAETSFVTLSDITTAAPDSVGFAYPQVSLQLRTPDGCAVADGKAGEVWVRSPYLFTGYAGGGAGSARWQDGWLSVGEMGVMRADGLHILGRAGRMVTVAGVNVFPEEVEAALRAVQGVEEAALIPTPDPARGHVLTAVLMGDPSVEPEARALMRRLLGPTAAPKRVEWRGDWPRLPSGKTDFSAL